MQKQVRQWLDFILFSNIFIACCAAAQTIFTYQQIALKPNLNLIVLEFSATLALYNFSMLMAKPKNPEASPFRRVRWIFAHQRLLLSIILIAGLSVLILSLFLSLASQMVLLLCGIIALSYNLPLFQIRQQKIGLRNIPGIKLLLIAGVWTFSTVLLPIIEAENTPMFSINTQQVFLLLSQRFLFIAAITIPFDIRDLYQDKSHLLKTIPVLLGERKAYLLCLVLLLLSVLLSTLYSPVISNQFWAMLGVTAFAGWLIMKSKWEKNEYYYFLFLDGVLILPTLLILLLECL